MSSSRKLTFVHVCGALAPYTHRLFEAVAADTHLNLNVLSCTEREPHRRWEIPPPENYGLRTLPGLRYHGSELANTYFNPRIIRELWRLRPDAISVGGLSPTMLLAIIYAIVTRTPWCLGIDGSLETDPGLRSRIHRWIRQFFVPRATVGIAASQGTVELFRHYGLPRSRCIVLPITVGWEGPATFTPYDERPFDVLFCGAINERKGADFFAGVLTRCKEKGRALRVRVVGHGPLEEQLATALSEAGIQAQFDGHLQTEELREAFSSAKVFAFPTRFDPWGLVVNEAILCGTPILASPHAEASKELVRGFQTGHVVPLDVDMWSDTLISMIDDRKCWHALQATHEGARGSFSIEHAVAAFRGVLEAVEEPGRPVVRQKVLHKLPAAALSGGLKALHVTRAHSWFAPRYRGLGAIFMMHRVDPVEPPRDAFAPHRHLSVTPDYLRRVIHRVRKLGYDTIALDDVPSRIANPTSRPFVAFTLDDGYRDNFRHAYPVFKAENVPFTIFVPSTWPEGRGELWWRIIEEVVARSDQVRPAIDGLPAAMPALSVQEKYGAFRAIQNAVVQMEEPAKYAHVRSLAERHGVDLEAICRDEIMSWTEIKTLTQDPLVTIGAHTRTHAALARLDDVALGKEIAASRLEIEAALGQPCRHFAFPYGGAEFAGPREFAAVAEAGFVTAVTGRRGLLYSEHADRLTSLPRIALEGNRQDEIAIEVQLSGVPFAILNGLRHQVA
jgi:peptidoglycan/xylan/chitin deacetylase (PgdA/CDA1 family)/glycosyltransferase involved in cell wall biosynthesis